MRAAAAAMASAEREGVRTVVLQHNLVNDSRAGLPESHAVLRASGRKEIIHFFVLVLRTLKILHTLDLERHTNATPAQHIE